MKQYIGIDLGGTNVRVAKVDENGNIVWDKTCRSHGAEGPKELVRDTIFSMLDEIEDLKSCEGIGIAVPGPIDPISQSMPIANNLAGFEGYQIGKVIEERYNIPVYLDNDANMAGLAEAVLGAGKGKPIVYYITHSTGVGGGLIINGKVISGKKGYAGEIGNVFVKGGCKKYSQYLEAGTIESESSGTGLGRKAVEVYGEGSDSLTVFENYVKGDPKAIELIEDMAKNMGRLLATIGQIVDPDCFVLGGGVSKQSDIYWPLMIETYHQQFNGVEPAEVLKAELKEPGVLGAAMLVKSNGKV